MAELGSCDYYGIPHEYSAMTCKHWHPAAPAPQAEGKSQTVTQCPKFAWCVMGHDHKGTCSSFHYELAGAAPAETAGPEFDGRVEDHKEYEAKLAARTAHHAREVSELLAKVADLERERDTLVRELCDMTPGGSEFVGDAKRCLAFIRDRMDSVVKQVKLRQAAESELREMREAAEKLLAKAGKISLSRSLVDTADLESLRLLARKAGS